MCQSTVDADDVDPVAGLHATLEEKTRHLVRAGVEIAIGDVRSIERNRDAVGVTPAGVFEHVIQSFAVTPAQRGIVADDRKFDRNSR